MSKQGTGPVIVEKIKDFNPLMGRRRKLLLVAAVLFLVNGIFFGQMTSGAKIIFSRNEIILKTLESHLPYSQSAVSQQSYNRFNRNVLASASMDSGQSEEASGSEDEALHQKESMSFVRNMAVLAPAKPVTFISQDPRSGIIHYTVQEGDVASSIAASFGISLNTLLWANDLQETSLIRPGDELTVLPVTGVLHEVKSSDTISEIANEYDAEESEIIAFNELPADGDIGIGQELIVPGGEMPAPVPTYSNGYSSYAGRQATTGVGKKGHQFPYGQCTWYVSQKRYVPWSGHAKQWLYNARAMGYNTGQTPKVGAVMVTSESWYGHVTYVEAIKGDWITFSEMNHLGWGIKSVRTLHKNNYKIRGYIY